MIKFKITAIRAFIVVAIVIIILYTLGLFLPIIFKSKKQSQLIKNQQNLTIINYVR